MSQENDPFHDTAVAYCRRLFNIPDEAPLTARRCNVKKLNNRELNGLINILTRCKMRI